ncbi:hypothetical protein ABPG72_021914 [Tetrahymena utriculariae]
MKLFHSLFNITQGDIYMCNGKQKELVITICQDMLANNKQMFEISQSSKQIYYVNVFVGEKQSAIDKFIFTLKQQGCMQYVTFVCSSDQDYYSLKYLSIFT